MRERTSAPIGGKSLAPTPGQSSHRTAYDAQPKDMARNVVSFTP